MNKTKNKQQNNYKEKKTKGTVVAEVGCGEAEVDGEAEVAEVAEGQRWRIKITKKQVQ